MLQSLAYPERDRHPPGAVCLRGNLDVDHGKHAKPQQVLARPLDLACTVLLAGVHEEPLAYDRFAQASQARDSDIADLDGRAGGHVKADIQHAIGRVLISDRRVHFCKGIPLILERRLQPLAAGQNIGRHCGHARGQLERAGG